jgi:hypothetical protein
MWIELTGDPGQASKSGARIRRLARAGWSPGMVPMTSTASGTKQAEPERIAEEGKLGPL